MRQFFVSPLNLISEYAEEASIPSAYRIRIQLINLFIFENSFVIRPHRLKITKNLFLSIDKHQVGFFLPKVGKK